MTKENKDLLNDVIQQNLKVANGKTQADERRKEAINNANQLIDRLIEVEKLEQSRNDFKTKIVVDTRKDYILKAIEIGSAVLIVPLVDYLFKLSFAKVICEFELNDSFRSTPGRTLSSLFRFRR